MNPETPSYDRLRDRMDIQDVLVRYFHGLDSGNRALVRSCFTDNVVAELEARPRVVGADALMGQIAAFGKLASGEWTITTHFMGSLMFRRVERAEAETEATAFAFLVLPDGPAHQVQMRSLRYVDQWARQDDQWKVAARLHTLDWSCKVPCDFARSFAERKNSAPQV